MNTSRYREVTGGHKGGERLVLTLIAMRSEDGEESDVDSLALDSGMSAKQILRITSKLKTDGAISVKGGIGRAPYTFTLCSEDILSSQGNEDFLSSLACEDNMSGHSQDKMSSQVIVKTKSPDESLCSEDILSGTPLAPSKDIRTSTDSSSASLQNIVGLAPDAPSVDERARALRKAIAELPKHKHCAQPTDDEWVTMLDIFAEWRRVMEKNAQAKLTPERGRALLDRLRSPVGFTREDFGAAIAGCRASPQHRGQNDRGTVYDDLELICRNDQNLERFKGYAEETGNDIPQRPATQRFGRPEVTRDFGRVFPRRAG